MNPPISSSLEQQFLIAMPNLNDPNFDHALIYICSHDDAGSMGLVINQPSEVQLEELLDSLDLLQPDTADTVRTRPVYCGGPLHQEQGFIIHTAAARQWLGTEPLADNLFITATKDILQDIACNRGPDNFLVVLGYSSWGPGQLDDEIQDNAWLHSNPDQNIMFNTPDHLRWQQAINSLGFNPGALSSDTGHA